jgi:aminoglycoside 3-N-acetyltransferase I
MDIPIKTLNADDLGDFNQLLTVFDIVFEYDPYQRPDNEHLKKLLSMGSFVVVVAKLDGKVIGGLTAYFLVQYHSTKPSFYIQDLAVMTAFQRRGVGRKLIEFSRKYSENQGCKEMYVQAEKVDDHAVAFYRSTRPTEELEAVHFAYSFPE